MTDANLIKDVCVAYDEAYSAEHEMHLEFEEDDGFYLGGLKQWNPNDLSLMMHENRTVITKNRVAKPVNLVTGYFRQNKMDLKYYPVERGDQEGADTHTELAKWIIENTGGREIIAYSFGDSVRVGMGWFEVKMKYDEDPLYGDVDINLLNKYNIMYDPYMSDPTLKDCNYILRYGYPTKAEAGNAYPDMEKEINKIKATPRQKFLVQEYSNYNDAGFRVNIVEKWYRVYEKMMVIIDPMTLESYEWTSGKRKFNQLLEARPELESRIALIEVKVPRIKLIAHAEDKILLYDDYAPEGFSRTMYPFIPMFCYYVPNFNDWAYKVKGIVRDFKDPQRELNKINAIYMDAAMTVPNSGWVYETTAVKDPDELDKTGGGQKIEVKPGKGLGNGIWQIQPPQMNAVLSQLYESYRGDMIEIGPSQDAMGVIGDGGSAADASGVTYQARVKQGLMSLQNPFDGAALAHRILGKLLMDLTSKWPDSKIARILGRPVPKSFRDNSRYDSIVDTKSSSPTYQLATYSQLQGYVQHGIQIPQSVLREAADIPFRLKQKWEQEEQAQVQQQLEMRQQEQQLRIAEIQTNNQALIQSKNIEMEGRKELEVMGQAGDERILEKEGMQKIAIEKLKQRKGA